MPPKRSGSKPRKASSSSRVVESTSTAPAAAAESSDVQTFSTEATAQHHPRSRKLHHTHTGKKSFDPRAHEYIPPECLEHLRTHKYTGSDSSIFGNYLMQYYWTAVAEMMPMTIAPNMITLLAFIWAMAGVAAIMFFYLVQGDFPWWAWAFFGFTLLVYSTLDAVDGKQARRTGTGSPMGELFDHGCDCFYCPFCQVAFCLVLDITTMRGFFISGLASMVIFMTVWEQFGTGTLNFGYINGATEGVLIVIATFWWTAYMGSQHWWSTPLVEPFVIPLKAWIPLELPFIQDLSFDTPNEMMFWFVIAAAVMTIASNVFNVSVKPSVRETKLQTFLDAVPIIVLFVGYHLFLSTFEELHAKLTYLPALTFGICCSFCATRLTISRFCHLPYKKFNKLTVANLVLVYSSIAVANFFGKGSVHCHQLEVALEWFFPVFLVGSIATYYHMISATFLQMMDFLGLNLLTFNERQKKEIAKLIQEKEKKAKA